jgi:hypothetical protein
LLYTISIPFEKGAQNLWDDMRGGRSYEKDEEDFGASAYYW